MKIVRHTTAGEFLKRARQRLEGLEAENNLILGIAKYFEANDKQVSVTPCLLTIEDGDNLLGGALMTPPRSLVLTRMPAPALIALEDYFFHEGVPVPGVVGPTDTARLFASHWKKKTGKSFRLRMSQRIYACERVLLPPYSNGYLRAAANEDQPLLMDWCVEFYREAGLEEETAYAAAQLPAKIAAEHVYVWQTSRVVSMVSLQRETSHGIALSLVYTPPHLRRQGYATSCVAALTRRMLEAGKKFCCLYTDLANPTSNSIYRQIGYRPVCDSEDLLFG